MELANYISFLRQAAESRRTAKRYHLIFAIAVVIVGLLAAGFAQLFGPESLKWLATIGSTFISTLASFPLKELLKLRDRITALKFLKREFERLAAAKPQPPEEELTHYTEQFWKYIGTSLSRSPK